MSLLDDLDEEGIVITRDGKPIAKILPCRVPASGNLIGRWKGKAIVMGDLVSTGERWDATLDASEQPKDLHDPN